MTIEALDPIPRDGWGRPRVIPPNGGPLSKLLVYTRATTIAGLCEDYYNLQRWQQRMVASGLALRPDYLLAAGLAVIQPDDDAATQKRKKGELDRLCALAIEAAEASAKATVGTALHALTERKDRGLDLGPVPIDYVADLAAYDQATAQLQHLWIEAFLVHDLYRIGGTPDRISEYQGRRYIVDVKTGQIELGIDKIAQQLAIYAHSKLYDPTTGERSLHDADLDRGIVIHLPAGTGSCRLYWIDLDAGWSGVIVSDQVRQRRRLKFADLVEPFESLLLRDFGPELVVSDPLLDAINGALNVEALTHLWQSQHQKFTEAHIRAAATKKARLSGSPEGISA